MRLIVDTNRVIASLMRDSVCRKILLDERHEFFAPDHMLLEIRKHKAIIMRKAKMTGRELDLTLSMITDGMEIASKEEIMPCMKEAKAIMDDIDPDDAPFIALALAIPNDGIWTEDLDLRKQDRVTIWSTRALVDKYRY